LSTTPRFSGPASLCAAVMTLLQRCVLLCAFGALAVTGKKETGESRRCGLEPVSGFDNEDRKKILFDMARKQCETFLDREESPKQKDTLRVMTWNVKELDGQTELIYKSNDINRTVYPEVRVAFVNMLLRKVLVDRSVDVVYLQEITNCSLISIPIHLAEMKCVGPVSESVKNRANALYNKGRRTIDGLILYRADAFEKVEDRGADLASLCPAERMTCAFPWQKCDTFPSVWRQSNTIDVTLNKNRFPRLMHVFPQRLRLVNVHLEASIRNPEAETDQRSWQLRTLLEKTSLLDKNSQGVAGTATLFAGDFNDDGNDMKGLSKGEVASRLADIAVRVKLAENKIKVAHKQETETRDLFLLTAKRSAVFSEVEIIAQTGYIDAFTEPERDDRDKRSSMLVLMGFDHQQYNRGLFTNFLKAVISDHAPMIVDVAVR